MKAKTILPKPKLYPLTQVASVLHVSKRTLYRYKEKGMCEFVKLGGRWMMRKEDMDRLSQSGLPGRSEEEVQE